MTCHTSIVEALKRGNVKAIEGLRVDLGKIDTV